jgi:hypothetical protein
MSVARHDDIDMSFGRPRKLPLKRLQTLSNEPDFFAQKQAHIESNLVVAATRRVELAPGSADFFRQTPLNIHVDIFVAGREREVAPFNLALNRFQPTHDLGSVTGRNNPLTREHLGVRDAPGNVMAIKSRIDIDGSRKRLYGIGCSRCEPSTPQLGCLFFRLLQLDSLRPSAHFKLQIAKFKMEDFRIFL